MNAFGKSRTTRNLTAGRLPVRRGAAVAAIAALAVTAPGTPPSSTLGASRAPITTTSVELLASQAAIMMNGTFTPDVTPEFAAAVMYNYIDPLVGSGYSAVPLTTPESLWPFSGLNTPTYNKSTKVGYQLLDAKYHEIVDQNVKDGAPNTPMLVFGYSQSAFIASLFDGGLSDEMKNGKFVPPTTFVLVGNTNIPNGGLMSRFNGLGLTPWTPVIYAPTKTGSPTYDACRQYDPFCDFPAYPLNALATVNSLLGYLLHFTLPISGNFPWMDPIIKVLNKLITPISLNPASPNYVKPIVSTYEDTIYEFVPTNKLPILAPLYALKMTKLADRLDPVLRPIIEVGYKRDVSFGVPTPASFRLFPSGLGPALKQSWQALVHPAKAVTPAAAVTTTASAAVTDVKPVRPSVRQRIVSPAAASTSARTARQSAAETPTRRLAKPTR